MKLINFAVQALIVDSICVVALAQTWKAPQDSARKQAARSSDSLPDYKEPNLPIERRVGDLLDRMTLQEKARQLDLYSGAKALVDKRCDPTHAAPDACPAQKLRKP